MQYEVLYGTHAVWVNDATGCLGRFSQMGIDVHDTIENQLSGKSQCLFCTHAPTIKSDWPRFVNAMRKFHGIDLSEESTPTWLPDRIGGG